MKTVNKISRELKILLYVYTKAAVYILIITALTALITVILLLL